jgi:hypothetical protein
MVPSNDAAPRPLKRWDRAYGIRHSLKRMTAVAENRAAYCVDNGSWRWTIAAQAAVFIFFFQG